MDIYQLDSLDLLVPILSISMEFLSGLNGIFDCLASRSNEGASWVPWQTNSGIPRARCFSVRVKDMFHDVLICW